MKKRNWLFLVPIFGTIFIVGYILAAANDVVYSDYIRLINSYLPDIWNPRKFFVADLFTRMPINFLERIINVYLFGYSTIFEMILGAICLGLSAVVLTIYCQERQIGTGWYLLLMAVMFSLNKWEMVTNGTGWCHFLAFAGFYFHYLIWDRAWREEKESKLLFLLPWLITLGTAGPYCGSYSLVLLLTYGFCCFLDWKQTKRLNYRYGVYGFHVLAPLSLYLLSNSFAVTEHAGATGRSLLQVLGDHKDLFPKFIIKSFSSMAVGEEALMELLTKQNQGMALCYLAGGLVLLGYLLALWMQLRAHLYKTTIFPLMLIFAGGCNHLLVLAARWIFENSSYGMSSRYALQYQAGIFGILLTFGLFFSWMKEGQTGIKPEGRARRNRFHCRTRVQRKRMTFFPEKVMAILISLVILAGNGYTTYKEIQKAPARKEYGQKVEAAARNYQEVPDQELEDLFQYRHGPEKIRNALGILEENKWNLYKGN